jgi:MSHA biogenesis protein MshJ
MKQWWRKFADKIDALSERERIIVFGAAVLVVLFVMTTLFISPSVTRIKTLTVQMQQQQTELAALKQQVQALESGQASPEALNRAHLDNLQQQIAAANSEIQGMQENLVPAEKMNKLLQDMLSRNPRLQLVAMRTLPASTLVTPPATQTTATPPAAGAATAQPASAPGIEDNIFKHGVEITLEGSYVDLHDYLKRIEQLPWRMFWARAELDAKDYPRLRLKLTIYTLSLDKAWLQV